MTEENGWTQISLLWTASHENRIIPTSNFVPKLAMEWDYHLHQQQKNYMRFELTCIAPQAATLTTTPTLFNVSSSSGAAGLVTIRRLLPICRCKLSNMLAISRSGSLADGCLLPNEVKLSRSSWHWSGCYKDANENIKCFFKFFIFHEYEFWSLLKNKIQNHIHEI